VKTIRFITCGYLISEGAHMHPEKPIFFEIFRPNGTFRVRELIVLRYNERKGGRMTKNEEIAGILDGFGITAVNFDDPVDGSPVAGIDLKQVEVLIEKVRNAALIEAWTAIHVRRFTARKAGFGGPDNFYHGVISSRNIVHDLVR
jgi:hypothetical protein